MFEDYLAGFFDGEGSMIIRFKQDPRYQSGYQIKVNIDIAQKNLEILELIKSKLEMGKIYFNKKEGIWHYQIMKFDDLIKFASILKGRLFVKKKKLEKFESCLQIITKKKHLTSEGLESIRMTWLTPKTAANT